MDSKPEATDVANIVIPLEPFQLEMYLGMLLDEIGKLGLVVARIAIMHFLHGLNLVLFMNHKKRIAGLHNPSMISVKVSVKGFLLLELP